MQVKHLRKILSKGERAIIDSLPAAKGEIPAKDFIAVLLSQNENSLDPEKLEAVKAVQTKIVELVTGHFATNVESVETYNEREYALQEKNRLEKEIIGINGQIESLKSQLRSWQSRRPKTGAEETEKASNIIGFKTKIQELEADKAQPQERIDHYNKRLAEIGQEHPTQEEKLIKGLGLFE